MQNRNLKAYARYDSSGRIIGGSTVLRLKKPKGNYQQVTSYECCNTIISVSATPTGVFATTTTITVKCGTNTISVITQGTATLATIVTNLNTNYPGLGVFSTDGTVLTLTGPICATAALTVVKS